MGVDVAEVDEVRVEKVSKVAPEIGVGKKKVVFLTCCDLVCRSYPYINRVFFFKSSAGASSMMSVMKEGLARALVSFYPLAGRFCLGEEGRLQIECGHRHHEGEDEGEEEKEEAEEEGAEFVEAWCELPFGALAQDGFQYRHLFWKLARRTHYLRCDYLHEPLLSIQVTKFRDGGGLSVGVSMSHAVGDAQSFYDFVKCWGEICRGGAMSVPPMHMRGALSVITLFPTEQELSSFHRVSAKVPNGSVKMSIGKSDHNQDIFSVELEDQLNVDELVKELEHLGAVRSAGLNGRAAARSRAPIMEKQMEEEEHRRPRSDLVQKVFSFSVEKLQHLKERVNAGMIPILGGNEAFSKMWNDDVSKRATRGFTTFEAFCAHWWQCLIRARCLPVGQPVFLLIPINCRQRFLDLPQSYFGNALDGGLVKLTAGELCEAELPAVAGKIHEAIQAATEESFKQYIREAETKRNAIPHFDRTGLFHIVDSPKYPVYDVDFGFGTPEAVRAEGFRFGAEVQILAGRLGPGSYDLFCALDSVTMYRLEHDPAFLAF